MNPLLEMLADDKASIPYRPRLNQITGSVTASILLQQIIYWYKQMKYAPFYKFKEKCNHEKYEDGDSWCEELGFTRREFDTALSKIAIKKNKSTRDDGNQAYVYYWITPQRITYYTIDENYLVEKLVPLYTVKADSADTKSAKDALGKGTKGSSKSDKTPLPTDDSANTKSAVTGIDNTKNTSETTSESYLIVIGAIKDKKFLKAFREFCDQDDRKYMDDKMYWIGHNAEKYSSSVGDIIDALNTCTDKSKYGDLSYFTGILREKAKQKNSGLTGHGKMLQIQIEEYLVERIGDNMQFIKQYDLDLDAGLLYYSIYSRDDREAVEECMTMYCADIKIQFDIELKPKFRL